ncbi:DUF1450 domain-containing protein [Shimazuella alba]|uniref:DUF1450 domain-containing protein n=1 Tax=Shimazuella alba TaxID=2690964 RepID=UPI003B832E18
MNNLTSDVLEIKAKLESNLDFDVLEYGCLGNCGLCARAPYALVNGELITAETAEELYKKILQACEEMEFRF